MQTKYGWNVHKVVLIYTCVNFLLIVKFEVLRSEFQHSNFGADTIRFSKSLSLCLS